MPPPIQFRPITMPFGITQDESAHPFVLPSPMLQNIRNGRVLKTGAIHKRPGWLPLCTIGSYSQLFEENGTLMAAQPSPSSGVAPRQLSVINRLGTVSPRADSMSGVAGLRSLSEVEVLGRENIWRDNQAIGEGISPYSSWADHGTDATAGIEVIAWTSRRAGLWAVSAVALDQTTRQPITTARIIQTPTTFSCYKPRVLALSGSIVVVYQREGANELRAIAYDTATRSWGTDTVVASDLHGTPAWDAFASGGVWYLALRTTIPNLHLQKMSGVTVTTSITIAEDPTAAIGVHADSTSGFVWVGYLLAGTGIRVAARATAAIGTVVLAPTTLEGVTDSPTQIAFATLSSTQVIATWSTRGFGTIATDNYGRDQTKYRTVTTAGALGTQCNRASFELISRPWVATNGTVYANVLYDGSNNWSPTVPEGKRSSGFATAFTMRVTHGSVASAGVDNFSWQPCASWSIGAGGMTRRSSSLSNVTAAAVATNGPTGLGLTEYRFMLCTETPIGIATAAAGSVITGASGVDMCRLNLSSANIVKQYAAPIGRNAVFSGGIPMVFDGQLLTEYGFLVPPENGRGVVSALGSPALTAGSVAVSVVAKYVLATGDIIRSAPAPVYGTTGATPMVVALNDKITVGVPSIGLTNKFSDISGQSDTLAAQLRLYRTEANGSLFLAESTIGTGWGATANLALQRLTNQSVVAQSLDSDLVSHAILYTTDGILPNYPLPSLSHLCTHMGRIFGVSAEDRRVIVFTHVYEPGELPGWHPDLQLQLDDEAVAVASLDDKLLIMAKHGVYVLTGLGPDRKGLNSDFNGPDRINGPHGCVSASSVVTIPTGVIFQAPTGMVIVDRGFGVTRIGGPVEDTLTTFPVVVEAKAWPLHEWVYWSVSNAAFSDFRVICFDWRNNVWSVDDVNITGESPYTPVVCGMRSFAVHGDEMYGTNNVGLSLYQHTGYDDLATVATHEAWITLYIRTAWIGVGMLQTFQRMRYCSVLGQYHGAHDLRVTIWQNYGAINEQFLWTNAEIFALGYDHKKHHIANQRTTATQIELTDLQGSATSPFTAGASFVGVSLDIGFKANAAKLPQIAMK